MRRVDAAANEPLTDQHLAHGFEMPAPRSPLPAPGSPLTEHCSLVTGHSSLTRSLTLGLGGGLLAHLLYGLTDAVALGAKPGVLLWMLLGLIAGLHAQLGPQMNNADSDHG